jgi:hypothetical protein
MSWRARVLSALRQRNLELAVFREFMVYERKLVEWSPSSV